MEASDLTAYSYLWDGSAPEWCLHVIHRHERRLVIVFDSAGPTARDVSAMRQVFEELRAQPANVVWATIKGLQRVPLTEVHSPVDAPGLTEAARRSGLVVEVLATDTVEYLPFNRKTNTALLIESDDLKARVAQRMLAAGVACQQVEVD